MASPLGSISEVVKQNPSKRGLAVIVTNDYQGVRGREFPRWTSPGILLTSAVPPLQERYKCKILYGTVVQLCVARNKRRRSAKNYKGLAKVTTRRARKVFEIKYKHWSCALYRNLNLIEYTDGSNITNINRDDASGFRLDTLATHGKHGTAAVLGKNVLTTYTDYVNKHPSILQTTSYNFSETKTTKEMAAGVVKGSKVFAFC